MKRITNNLVALIVTLACWTPAGAYQLADTSVRLGPRQSMSAMCGTNIRDH